MIDTPAWRLDDAAAYDAMRDAASTIVGRLAAGGDAEGAAAVWARALRVDGMSREAVDSFTADLRGRLNDGGLS